MYDLKKINLLPGVVTNRQENSENVYLYQGPIPTDNAFMCAMYAYGLKICSLCHCQHFLKNSPKSVHYLFLVFLQTDKRALLKI